jgi:hypothetical protein
MNDVPRGRTIKKYLMTGALLMLLFTELSGTAHGAGKLISSRKLITLNNKSYEVAVELASGSIRYILDKKTRQKISTGNRDGILWGALTHSGRWISSSGYGSGFTYGWEPRLKKLTLNYPGQDPDPVDVTVSIAASGDQYFTMQAVVNNRSDIKIQAFRFPYDLNVAEDRVTDALLPMIPGVKLRSGFFTSHQSYSALYPGVMFADYLALRSSQGQIAVYGQKGNRIQPVNLGFAHDGNNPGHTSIIHHYQTWIESGKQWVSPVVVIRVGQEYPQSIAAYRRENGMQDFQSLAAKLGPRKQQYFESPLYKMDLKVLRKSFSELKAAVIDNLAIPGIIHPVAFQPGGHDRNYPDFIPPAALYGTGESLAELVKYAQSKGNLVIPYTNFSWWNTDSPTLRNLPAGVTPKQIAVNQPGGTADIENYGSDGYVVNFYHEFVAARIAAEHEKLISAIGFDGIFEDQLGARDARYDYNPAGWNAPGAAGNDPATSYFEGILGHTQALAKHHLMTECGIDRLARDEIGFMGTNYLWDLLGYRKATADYSDYYPMIGMLCRDKVLLYQHNLAIETWTDDKDMFRWNLAFGYNFSAAFNDMNSPWLPLIGVFQKYVLSRYTDELVTGFDDLGNRATRTSFGSYKVYANWDDRNTLAQSGHVVAPGGALVVANDGSVTAGVFTNYNGNILNEGEHYLVEVRSKDNIKVFQPMGTNTPIHVKKYSSWPGVTIGAYGYDGEFIAETSAVTLKDDVLFDWNTQCSDKKVMYYQLTRNNQPSTQGYPIPAIPDLVVTDISWSPAEIAVGDAVAFQATIKNNGTGATPAGTILGIAFELDGQPLFWSEYFKASLAAGAIATLKVTRGETKAVWEATAGLHVITAWADKTNQIPEIIENNNSFSKNIPPVDEAVIIDGVRKPKSAANRALNKPVISSGATAPAYGERLVNDGFTNTYWESVNNVFPASLTVDLGVVQDITKVVLKLPPFWELRVQTIALEGSTENLQFNKILAPAQYTFDPTARNTVTITFAKTGARFLKLIFTGNTGWPAGQMAEVEVFN